MSIANVISIPLTHIQAACTVTVYMEKMRQFNEFNRMKPNYIIGKMLSDCVCVCCVLAHVYKGNVLAEIKLDKKNTNRSPPISVLIHVPPECMHTNQQQ